MPAFRIVQAGDAALVVQLPERIDLALNAWCVALAGALTTSLGTVVRDVVIGYSSVTVYFDPLAVDDAWLEGEVRAVAGRVAVGSTADGPLVEVPVCYGGRHGPDLADVAAFAGCSEAEVIRLHADREYHVYMVGFVPGFAYMAEVDPRIAAPRRRSPRAAVPARSVAIALGQTGVYPAKTPGGWNIIGRTAVAPFDPHRKQPFLFACGDRVRFRSISEAEFLRS